MTQTQKPKPTYAVVSHPDPDAANRSLQVLFTGRSQTKPGHRLGPKVFDHFLIHYVESGRGVYTAEGREYALGAGDSFVIYPEALVSYAADEEEPWQYRWIAFKGEEAERLVAAGGVSPETPMARTREGARAAKWFERVMKTFRDKEAGAHLRANGCLQLLLAEYADARRAGEAADAAAKGADDDGPAAALTRQAIHYMTTQYAEPITIELMAESLGYNRAYLSRVFRERTGATPVAFLVRLRLDRARRLLRERPLLTVEQVASSVGFADALYFSKQFRRAYGQSPTEYRRSVKQY
ncbi:AraC family transcriptional regulator [Paenibacillus antri]|uniref:AraC family transcriptional regulator n=1 Tax=Paenibacillus antri TaxID=2582848 RepID=A0A5R9G6V0_9BACL|nr:AraC family transcriptional regulator [Paenibacillus antri]TLS49178.1 AraC family transcriptional regulator [Paenibacillus antri]